MPNIFLLLINPNAFPFLFQWSEKRRFEIAGLLSSVLRAHLHAYDPIFSMTLKYLIRYLSSPFHNNAWRRLGFICFTWIQIRSLVRDTLYNGTQICYRTLSNLSLLMLPCCMQHTQRIPHSSRSFITYR